MRSRKFRTLVLILALSVAPSYAASAKKQGNPKLRHLMDRYWSFVMTENPEFATSVGFPGQNRRWSDRSPGAYRRRAKAIENFAQSLSTVSRSSLSETDRMNLDLFQHQLNEARESTRFREEVLPLSQMFGVQNEVPMTIGLMPAQTVQDYEDILARLEALPTLFKQVGNLLREGARLGATYPEVAMAKVTPQLDGLLHPDESKNPLLAPFRAFPTDLPEAEQARLKERASLVFKSLVRPALDGLKQVFVTEYLPACRKTVGWNTMPSGDAWYAFKVRQSTTTQLSPQEIHQIGLKEVARLREAMEKVKDKAGFSGSLAEFNDFLRTDDRFFYTTTEDLLRGYRDLAKRVDPELPRLFGKLPRLTYGVLPIPEHAAPSQPTAYYQPGSPTAGRAGNFFANTYDLKARPKWEMEPLTVHEAVPGHHLQIALAQEMENVPEFRKYTDYNAFVEGWGLYAESLGSELGLYKDVYAEYGRLAFEMWRSVRLVVDTGMHTMGWSREKAIDYFVQNSAKPKHDVVQEVERYLVMPGQALGYKIGQLKILELRKYAEKALGARFSLRAFHDAVLENGSLPLDVLDARIKTWVNSRNPALNARR